MFTAYKATRQKMPEEVFALVFQRVLAQCAERGLVQGRALGSDSTVVDANASLASLTHRELGCTYQQYMLALRRQDQPEQSHRGTTHHRASNVRGRKVARS